VQIKVFFDSRKGFTWQLCTRAREQSLYEDEQVRVT